MATVHNAYYNSPWIADAARNLASALAPPDPEKQLAAQRDQWEFERKQQLASIEDTDRENQKLVEDYHAEMLRPVVNPLTGEIDQKLTNEKIMRNWSDAIDIGADPKIGASLSGELNPDVAVKRMMAQMKAAQAMQFAGYGYDRRGGLQDDAQAHDSDEKAKQRQWQGEQNAMRLKNHLDGIRLRGSTIGGGKGPNEIPVPIIKEIAFGLDDLIAATGRDMSLENYNRFAENIAKRWQENGNVQQSINEQWATSFPNSRTYAGAEADPDQTGFWSNSRGNLAPVFQDDPAAATDLGPIVAPDAARTPTPVTRTAPPAEAAPAKPKPKPPGTVAPPPKKRKPIESFGR